MRPEWKLLHPKATLDMLGFIPDMLSTLSDVPAATQLHAAYGHGGGWNPFKGFKLNLSDPPTLSYLGDPPTRAIAETKLRHERIIVFEHAWVAIVQPDGMWEVARMD